MAPIPDLPDGYYPPEGQPAPEGNGLHPRPVVEDEPADEPADSPETMPEAPSEEPTPASAPTPLANIPLITVTLGEREYTDVVLKFGLYDDPENLIPALQLYSDEGAGLEPLATATVNVPDWGPEDGCIMIKDWSENEGMMASLVDSGVIEDTGFSLAVNEWGSLAYQGRVLPPFAAELDRIMMAVAETEA